MELEMNSSYMVKNCGKKYWDNVKEWNGSVKSIKHIKVIEK